MKKSEQLEINALCEQMEQKIKGCYSYNEGERLRTCNARVITDGCYYILISYNTIVAIIDTTTDTLYDILRLEYGYTSTSAQHIAKFDKDYCQGKWGCTHRYTWRAV
mgnify:CR=1 FL=1